MDQGKYEIGLDEVENLGYFIEIENKKYEKPILEEYDELISTASNLNINLNNITKKGYPHILLEEKIQGQDKNMKNVIGAHKTLI